MEGEDGMRVWGYGGMGEKSERFYSPTPIHPYSLTVSSLEKAAFDFPP